jgi:geranylgeranyl pyrophosphate synthase
MFNIHFG